MNWPAAALALLLFPTAALADGGHPERYGPMPPDPVMVNRAAWDATPALLALQRMSLPGDLHLWQMLKSTIPLSTAQVRTAALDLLRVRRFYDEEHPADVVFLAAWFDREPVTATREVVNVPDWEDRDDNISDYDSDVEYFGERLWEELARTDFPAALKIAAGLKGIETKGQFFSGITYRLLLSPRQSADIAAVAWKQLPAVQAAEFMGHLAGGLHQRLGAGAAMKWARSLPLAAGREAALTSLAKYTEPQLEEDDPFAFPPLDEPELAKLKALNIPTNRPCRIPFPLLREVLQRTPEQALDLLRKLPENQRRDGWMGWMLLMRAMEGDARAAGAIGFHFARPGWIQHVGAPLFLTAPVATVPGEMDALRDVPADQQDAALESALCRAPLEHWEKWAALARELAAPVTAIRPLLVRMAASGHAAQALELAATFPAAKGNAGAATLCAKDIFSAWALHDFRAAAKYASTLKPGPPKETACQGLNYAIHRLPAETALEQWPDGLSAGEVEPQDHYWVYLAFENREAGFRFFGSHEEENSSWAATTFATTAARLDPIRAVQLVSRYSSNKYALQNLLCRIVCHWPDRFHEFLAPVSSEETWQAVAATVAGAYPQKTAAILKGVPYASVWDTAGRELAFTHPELMPAIVPHMSESVRYRVMVEKRRD